jgi:hypothetical protein
MDPISGQPETELITLLQAVRRSRDILRGYVQTRSQKRRRVQRHTFKANIGARTELRTYSNGNSDARSSCGQESKRATFIHDNNPTALTRVPTSTNMSAGSTSNFVAPKNDYSQHFVDSGIRPQNFIRDSERLQDRFEEYPKLRELISLKDQLIRSRHTPPFYLKVNDMRSFDLSSLGTKFDVILIDPPWPE